VALAILLVGATAGSAAAETATSRATLNASTTATAKRVLAAITTRSGDRDTQYYAGDGNWQFPQLGDCWFCAAGPGTLAATLWRLGGEKNDALFTKSVQTFDKALATHTNADGSFGDPDSPDTQFFGVELGTAFLLLGDKLDAQTRTSWSDAITKAADHLIVHKDIQFEINGNVNLGQTEFEYLAWVITGQDRFRSAYNTAWQYTVSPPQKEWPGFGLHVTKASNGPDAAGYLAENAGQGPGFDPEYTTLQLSVASRLYLLSGQARFGKLTSELYNVLSPLTNHSTWILDARNGTRKSHVEPLTSSGLVVLSSTGLRPDLDKYVKAQLKLGMDKSFVVNAVNNWGNAGYYRGYGNELGVALLALAQQKPEGNVPGAPTSAQAAPAKTAFASVQATAGPGGVKVSWTRIGDWKGRPAQIVIDGQVVGTSSGRLMEAKLNTGLHLVSVMPAGLTRQMPASIVTVPAAWAH
jgi:hypothetical protein